MNPRFKTNVIGLAVALGTVLAGYSVGEPPTTAAARDAGLGETLEIELAPVAAGEAAAATRDALIRHVAMPYVSFAVLTPRQES